MIVSDLRSSGSQCAPLRLATVKLEHFWRMGSPRWVRVISQIPSQLAIDVEERLLQMAAVRCGM